MQTIETGDIILFKGKTPFVSPLVKWVTGSEYTHVGMAFSERLLFEIDLSKQMAIHPLEREVPYDVFRYKDGLTDEQKNNIMGKAIERASHNKGYDWWRTIGFALEKFLKLPWVFNMSNREVCSEIVDYVYSDINIDLVPERANGNVRPADFLNSSQLTKIDRLTSEPTISQVL